MFFFSPTGSATRPCCCVMLREARECSKCRHRRRDTDECCIGTDPGSRGEGGLSSPTSLPAVGTRWPTIHPPHGVAMQLASPCREHITMVSPPFGCRRIGGANENDSASDRKANNDPWYALPFFLMAPDRHVARERLTSVCYTTTTHDCAAIPAAIARGLRLNKESVHRALLAATSGPVRREAAIPRNGLVQCTTSSWDWVRSIPTVMP